MKRRESSAPIWLFSFVDLAFLLLIAFTQLAPDPEKEGLVVGELELPRIAGVAPAKHGEPFAPLWQLRVLPLAGSDDPNTVRAPFELIEPGARSPRAIGADELASGLEVLHVRALPRPVLAPHRDARSEDLLVAVALLERIWANDRGITVVPAPTGNAPAIAAAGESARPRR